MPPSDSLNDPHPATDAALPLPTSAPSINGEDETALARLADDGGPPSASPTEAETSFEPKLADASREAPPIPSLSLEERVRRLEEVVALLQEHRPAPARVAMPAEVPGMERPPEARPVSSPAVPVPPVATAVILDLGKRLLGASSPSASPAPAAVPSLASSANRASLLWFLWDTWAEARAIVRMFLDPRYQLPWSARALSLVFLAAILTSYYWLGPISSIPLLGGILNKLVDLLLAFLLFKWLGHEARRYRQTSPDLPANLRL